MPKGQSGSRYFNFDGDGESSSGRARCPRNLRGKQIGLWHSRQSRQGREEKEETKRRLELPENHLLNKQVWRQRRQEAKFEERRKKPLGSILISEKKKKNINQVLDETTSLYPSSFLLKTTSYEHLEETDFKHEFLKNITGNIIQTLETKTSVGFGYKSEIEDQMLLKELKQKVSSANYRKMQEVRKKLPSMGMRDAIVELINKNQVVVISGETGCGKTTQVSQFILDHYIENGKGSECRVMCTQPRRISAIAVAERVAQERDEKLGQSVGFQIRLEKTLPRERGSILFCTTGVLLKYMEGDPSLSRVSHVVIDEIHERNIPSDFLITLLKDVIRFNSNIKIILMSATLNAEAFSKYYDQAPHLNIPGFTYPVEVLFLEDVLQFTRYKDPAKSRGAIRPNLFLEPYLRQLEAEKKYDRLVINELRKARSESLNKYLIFELIKALCLKDNDNGAILVFVPGFQNIKDICTMMRESNLFPPSKYIVFPLHSQLATVDQKRIFNPAPNGMRKIIISTNIAETSITIDDVTTVIDSGYIKMSSVDPDTGIEKLAEEFVSQANALQRKGRAGRVKPGVCFHLLTRARYESLDKYLKPEVLRKGMEEVILQLKMLQLGDAESFLARLMDPPEAKTVQRALTLLQRLGGLDEEENLTPLGYHMAKLPVGPQCSKMLILSALFSCVDPVLSIAASLGFKDARQLSTEAMSNADQARYELSNGTNSDHLTMHYAIRGFENSCEPRAFCRKYYLSYSILRLLVDMRRELAQHLFAMRFISNSNPRNEAINRNSDNVGLVKAIVAAGLYPNIAINKRGRGNPISKFDNIFNESMTINPGSVLAQSTSCQSSLCVYQVRRKYKNLQILDGTMVFPLPIIFFGDQFRIHTCSEDDKFSGVSVNGSMRFLCSESTALIIQRLRDRLAQILEWKLSHPGFVDLITNNSEANILKVIIDLITTEDSEDLDLSDYEDL